MTTLTLRDPLAELLGYPSVMRYTYEDVVKLSGHSCPTVAGAFLMTAAALEALYGGDTPVRGDLEVTLGGAPDDGTTGPMAQVITLLTGAATELGFGGLGGLHRRRGLLGFDPALERRVRFRRRDTGATVEVTYAPRNVPSPPELGALMPEVLGGHASAEQRARFGALWQARVRDLLEGDRARVIEVRPVAS